MTFMTYDPITRLPRSGPSRKTARNADILLRYLRGESVGQVCQALDIGRQTVYRLLKRHGVKLRPAQLKNRKVQREDWPSVAYAYAEEGLSGGEVARRYQVAESVIYLILKEMGVARRPPGNPWFRKGVSRQEKNLARKSRQEKNLARKVQTQTKPAEVVKVAKPMADLKPGMLGSGRQLRRAPLRLGFPPLPGEPGYVYG